MGKSLTWEPYRARIDQLRSLDFNYDERVYHASRDKTGWKLDHYQASLAFEQPGSPGKAWAAVQGAVQLYRFPDPNLIRAIFDPDGPLPGRNMLLLARFAGLTFEFGVRVVRVIDETRKNSLGETLKVWGYAYRTLRGHFEIGEIRFELMKNINTGELIFEVDAYSKPDRIPNPFFRMGFKMFGRGLQRYFAESSIRRLKQIAREALQPHQ